MNTQSFVRRMPRYPAWGWVLSDHDLIHDVADRAAIVGGLAPDEVNMRVKGMLTSCAL